MSDAIAGYVVFAIGLIAIVGLMTAYYVWRARHIANKWWRRAERGNDPDRRRRQQ